MPLEDKGTALLFALQEWYMQSICEADTAAGPTYHIKSVYTVSFLAFI